jgi:hypothetical protein
MKSKKSRYILDTSIQIDKFKPNSKSAKYVQSNDLFYSSNFVFYEFKSGFVKALIEYYLLVEVSPDVPTAMGTWSNNFSKRDQSNIHILNAVTGLMSGSIVTDDKAKALRQIEAAIFYIVNNFDTGIVELVGAFGSDEVVKFEILSSAQYKPFLNLIRERKDMIELEHFWLEHSGDLTKLLSDPDRYNTDALRSILTKLTKISTDSRQANKFRVNKGVGDAVIAADCLGSMILVSLDHSFEAMMPLLGKEFITI